MTETLYTYPADGVAIELSEYPDVYLVAMRDTDANQTVAVQRYPKPRCTRDDALAGAATMQQR